MAGYDYQDENLVTEVSFDDFVQRLGLPPGSTVTSIGMIWFDLNYGSAGNRVRVHYRPGRSVSPVPLKLVAPPLEDRLRRLAAKWRSQSRHPMRRNKPEEAAMLVKHADELMAEVGTRLPREVPAGEGKQD